MKIEFERTGGFMGLRIFAEIDTADLPPEEAEAIHKLLAEANFFALSEELTASTPGTDYFHYRLTVTPEDGEAHTVRFTDSAAPLEMLPLVRRLTRLARGQ